MSARNSGQALVPVLFVVLILTALAVSLTGSSKREIRATANHLKDAQQVMIAKGAVNYAAAELQQATSGGVIPPQLTQPPDTDSNGWTALGDGWYKLDIIDTASRINVNTVDATALNKLPAFINDPNLAPAVIDWRDADDNPTTIPQGGTGAESDYYQSLTPPYYAKNAPFDTIDELLLVRGFTPQILYGVNGQIAGTTSSASGTISTSPTGRASSRQAVGLTGQSSTAIDLSASTTPLSELFTTYSKEANYAADGTKRVNIRTASANALTTMLTSAGVSTGQARQLVTQFTQTTAQQRQSQQMQVTSLGDLLGKRNPGGPLPLVTAWPKTVLQSVADKLTVRDDAFLNGMININTAPTEVLATIPGIDQTLLSLIQTQQQSGGFTSVNDLFQGSTFTAAQLGVLYGRVCVKSSIYMARVRVRMPGSQRIYAIQALIELPQPTDTTQTTSTTAPGTGSSSGTTSTTTAQPKILQWREVARTPGWSGWSPAPNYYGGSTITTQSGGTVGN